MTIAVGEGAKASNRKSTLKTRVDNDASVSGFVAGLPCAVMRKDCTLLSNLLGDVTGEPAKLWGGNTVGFGSLAEFSELGQGQSGLRPAARAQTTWTLV